MKHFLLTFFIALAATVSSNAQTLQVDPIYIGGTAAFEVQGGTPNGVAIVCYSLNGTGPFTLANGLSLDLSMPIRQLSPMVLNGIGAGSLGPFPTPSSAIVGMQVWFQAVDVNIWSNPALTTTNMVPITVQNMPNNPPTAVDDNASTRESVTVTIDVMANDGDIDGDAISLIAVDTPTNGTASLVGGQIEYAPMAGYVGIDYFDYIIEDVFGAQATATVFMDVFRNQGELEDWGRDNRGQVSGTPTGNDFIQASAGAEHSVALRADGSLESWGSDSYGQMSGTPTTSDFTQVAAGGYHSVALRADGSLISWGLDHPHYAVRDTPAGNDFIQVSGGLHHSVALRADGSLISWGDDSELQVANTPGGNDFIQVSAGGMHSVALRDDGSLESWGSDAHSQIFDTPGGNDFIQVSGGSEHSIALRADGSLESWGSDAFNEVGGTPSGNDFVQVTAGGDYSVVLRSNGSLEAWGRNDYYQTGNVLLGNDIIHVSSGFYHSVAIRQ